MVDFANERWEEMENPSYGEGNFNFTSYLGVLRNDLSMICRTLMTHEDVWVMKEYGVKVFWTKKCFVLGVLGVVSLVHTFACQVKVIFCIRMDQISLFAIQWMTQ